MKHLTSREAKAVLTYANAVASMLGLPRWRITLGDTPCGDDSHAEVEWVSQRNLATIRLCPEWLSLDDDLKRDTITHEVLHLVHTRVSTIGMKDAARFMHAHEHADWWGRQDRELELMVDMLAGCLSNTAEAKSAWRNAYGR